ncbi:KilA-N domain-containing protein [Avibacterium sp. 20-15]|uniref:KilA-N domain-containing protein n=1 Tax=unclassified Avibacterium TaxID=2685287 RepID=UPI002026601F|nr:MULTISPECIES: KilA-N domain-containing protein [unclassified Avibacterium]MCW9731960.1 KilA-N domain-containing protein [Avibacterium sp. 20-15]URL04149.1 KilA-N domain-containing protein [Avibacterium sp. 20-132]
MSNLQILSNQIRENGNLYSLNDLHIASGGENKHRPALFIRLETTKELIAEMENENQPRNTILVVKNGLGSYACEELVIAYAAWISAAFHLKVIRAFMAMHKSEVKQQNLPLAEVDADEEAIRIIANLYHSLRGAFEMGEKIRKQHPYFAKEIDKTIGGHYLYNLNHPTEQALEKAKRYVHAKSERIMFIKGMLSLLDEQPQPKRLANF